MGSQDWATWKFKKTVQVVNEWRWRGKVRGEQAEAGPGWANGAAEPGWEGAGSAGGGRSWDLRDGVGGTYATATVFRLDQACGQ